jgi:hypothetical protein
MPLLREDVQTKRARARKKAIISGTIAVLNKRGKGHADDP